MKAVVNRSLLLNVALLLSLALMSVSCKSDDNNPVNEGTRIGAVCKDGTTSTATGSGACSSHGGVDHWIYR